MPSSKSVPLPTPSSSTRLENIRFARDRASCEIDGQAVVLTGERAAPAIQAFQAFYQEAYRAYGLAPEAAEEARIEPAPWWQRLRGWLARLIGGAEGPARPAESASRSAPNSEEATKAARPRLTGTFTAHSPEARLTAPNSRAALPRAEAPDPETAKSNSTPEAAAEPRGEKTPMWLRLRNWAVRRLGGGEGPARPADTAESAGSRAPSSDPATTSARLATASAAPEARPRPLTPSAALAPAAATDAEMAQTTAPSPDTPKRESAKRATARAEAAKPGPFAQASPEAEVAKVEPSKAPLPASEIVKPVLSHAEIPEAETPKAETTPAVSVKSATAKREAARVESPSAATKTNRPSVGGSAVAREPGAPPPPLLMTVFADEKGIHLLWNLTPGVGADQIKERSYGFDSKVATRLQDCYSQLSGLGYHVTDLKVWQRAPGPTADLAGSPQALDASATRSIDPVGLDALSHQANSLRMAKPGEPKERVVRLLPANHDHPERIAVVPIEGDLTPLVLADTPKNVAALHAAADAAQPPEKRLTFLTCTIGPKGEPKLAEYVTGEDPHDASKRKPIAALEADAVKVPKAAKTEPRPDPNAVGGQSALRTTRSTPAPGAGGQEPGLFPA